MTNETTIIIGGLATGMSCASELKRKIPQMNVQVITQESLISYGACGMPFVISGHIKKANDLIALSVTEALDRGIQLKLQTKAISINRKKKLITTLNLQTGETLSYNYDYLVLATGAAGFVPPIEGNDLEGIFTLKNYQNMLDISHYIQTKKPKRAIICGAGFIGLEMLEALYENGLEMTLVSQDFFPKMDSDLTSYFLKVCQEKNIKVILGKKVTSLEKHGSVFQVTLENKEQLKTDLILFGLGFIPQSGLAKESGLELDIYDTIKVNDYLQTSDPHIFSGGDAVASRHLLLEEKIYSPFALKANQEGKLIAQNIANLVSQKPLQKAPCVTSSLMLKFFHLEYGKTGIGEAEINQYNLKKIERETVSSKPQANYYSPNSFLKISLYYNKKDQTLVGAQILGTAGSVLRLHTLTLALKEKVTLEKLAQIDFAYSPPFSPLWDPMIIAAKKALKKNTPKGN
jgi:NADPH-dependent 2,4-dienoyl-CoA reductase/sulfur reductase-like enzyme